MKSGPFDALIIGAGPAGSACAYWLAQSSRNVAVVEKKTFPREKTCGDGLTPRAVKQLQDMGLEERLQEHLRYDGLRAIGHGRTLEMRWPEHPDLPNYGFVIRRRDLDEAVSNQAQASGAEIFYGVEAVEPIIEDGILRGAAVEDKASGERSEIRSKYLVVAEGANSRFGRTLGITRNREYPLGMAIRGYYKSPMHDDPWIESHLDISDRDGNHLPGYGWIFPVGDGSINVGVGLLSTFKGWKSINTTKLMNTFCEVAPDYWEISPENSQGDPTGGRLPTGLSVTPRVGPNFLVAGDSAGGVNPFNGEGISVAYETGRMAAEAIDLALATGDGLALNTYEKSLEETYGLYFRVARLFVAMIGNPAVMRELSRIGFRSKTLMEWVLRIMANLLRPDEIGPAEAAYKMIEKVVQATRIAA